MAEKASGVAQAKAELAVAQAKLEVAEATAKLFLAESKEGSPEAKERHTEERHTEERHTKESKAKNNWEERDENGWGKYSNLTPWD